MGHDRLPWREGGGRERRQRGGRREGVRPGARAEGRGGVPEALGAERGRRRGGRGPHSTHSPSPLSGPPIPLPFPLARRHLGPRHPGPKQNLSAAVPGPRSARKQEASRLLAAGTAGYPPSKARCHWPGRGAPRARTGAGAVWGLTRPRAGGSASVFSEDSQPPAGLPAGGDQVAQWQTEKTLKTEGPCVKVMIAGRAPLAVAHSWLGPSPAPPWWGAKS